MKQIFYFLLLFSAAAHAKPAIVLETDFGLKDGAVSAMRGVIASVDPEIKVSDLTHDIPPYNIWEGGYRLVQTAPYWPQGTIFVIVVDPGVGTNRKPIVAKSKNGMFFVTPDNGTLTLVDDRVGIESARVINDRKFRRKGVAGSYTFDGRDLFSHTAALLASGRISFDQVGEKLEGALVKLPYEKARMERNQLIGTIEILDPAYGNAWTNISLEFIEAFRLKIGETLHVKLTAEGKPERNLKIPYVNTFGDVPVGKPLLYKNSLLSLALAINEGDFAKKFGIAGDGTWRIEITK